MANSVNLVTRVRVDIMRSITKKFRTERDELFGTSFSCSWILQVRSKGGEQRSVPYTFLDAVLRYGTKLVKEDLGEEFGRAGVVVRG